MPCEKKKNGFSRRNTRPSLRHYRYYYCVFLGRWWRYVFFLLGFRVANKHNTRAPRLPRRRVVARGGAVLLSPTNVFDRAQSVGNAAQRADRRKAGEPVLRRPRHTSVPTCGRRIVCANKDLTPVSVSSTRPCCRRAYSQWVAPGTKRETFAVPGIERTRVETALSSGCPVGETNPRGSRIAWNLRGSSKVRSCVTGQIHWEGPYFSFGTCFESASRKRSTIKKKLYRKNVRQINRWR